VGVIIGMDPHKRSATIEVIDERGAVLAKGRFGTDTVGYRQMLVEGRRFVDRVSAMEGCSGIGKHLAHRPRLRDQHPAPGRRLVQFRGPRQPALGPLPPRHPQTSSHGAAASAPV
jgi:hypothetical protein